MGPRSFQRLRGAVGRGGGAFFGLLASGGSSASYKDTLIGCRAHPNPYDLISILTLIISAKILIPNKVLRFWLDMKLRGGGGEC